MSNLQMKTIMKTEYKENMPENVSENDEMIEKTFFYPDPLRSYQIIPDRIFLLRYS